MIVNSFSNVNPKSDTRFRVHDFRFPIDFICILFYNKEL